MEIDQAHYHGWHGKLQSPWIACLAIVRVALVQVVRNKAYWVVLGLGALRFLAFWSIIYAVTQLTLPGDVQKVFLEQFGFSADAAVGQDNGYIRFMAGPERDRDDPAGLFRQPAGRLRFSAARCRFICRGASTGGITSSASCWPSAPWWRILTVVPALLLFLEYGMFTSSTDYWVDNWRSGAGGAGLRPGDVRRSTASCW